MKLHVRTPLKPSGRLDTSGIRRSVILTEKKLRFTEKGVTFYTENVNFIEKSVMLQKKV